MRARLPSMVGVALVTLLAFPPQGTAAPAVLVREAALFGVSRSARTLAQEQGGLAPSAPGAQAPPMLPLPRGERARSSSLSLETDAALQQTVLGTAGMPAPLRTFEGISNADNFAVYGSRILPPDTNGAIGPNHYVQSVNLLLQVFDRVGNDLTPPFRMSSLFAGIGGPCAANDSGDPIVLYDHLADRWLVSQFALPGGAATPPYHQCIAISQTPDPTGAYFAYDFVMPGNNLNDYPKFGVWPDGYYMTDNQFLNGTTYRGAGAFAFDRERMLRGEAASFLYFNLFDLDSEIGGMLPADADGLVPPPPDTPNYFAYFTATEFGDLQDGLRIFEFHADFETPGNATFLERAEGTVSVASFDPTTPAGRQDVAQPAPGVPVDAIGDRLMFRLQYRNFGAYESLVVNHTVSVSSSPYRAAVRYYEIRRPLPGGAFSVNEQATFAPDTTSRWMGSAAMDHQGNLAVGYSAASTSVYPSIRYAGRLAGDPPNQLTQGEATLVAGSGVQTDATARWGDYSAMTMDPVDDCTFWFTTEYYTSAGQASSSRGWQTRVGSFRFDGCTPAPQGMISGTITRCASGQPISDALVSFSNGFSQVTNAGGAYARTLAPGTYTVTVSKALFPSEVIPGVVVSDGQATALNACLEVRPVIVPGAQAVVTESCSPGNGVIDPNETVSVSLGLVNQGTVNATNLIATLLPGGGVMNPGGSVSYGAMTAGGAAVTRSLSFTAASLNCSDVLTATLGLDDAGTNLGTVSFDFSLGSPATSAAETFDGVTAPSLPAGWVAVLAAGRAGDFPWRTSTTSSASFPNNAFAPNPNHITDNRLDSPAIPIASASARLTFRNNYQLEDGYDGGVLEVSLGGGSFVDILAAGGAFVSGGYDGTISTSFGNPIGGRPGWTGNSGGYVTTIVELPPASAGQSLKLRWRLGTDTSVADVGWRIDAVDVLGSIECCETVVTPTNTPTATATRTATPTNTQTPTVTATQTPSASPTSSATNTSTATMTWTPTRTPTSTPTASFTPTPKASLDVDVNGVVDVATDIVYIARRLIPLAAVPQSFRDLDPTIPPDGEIAGRVDALGDDLDVDENGLVDVATDIVYIARRILGFTPVPQSFRDLDPTIPPDDQIGGNIDLLLS